MPQLHFETWGDGTRAVLVHGSLATGAEEWQAQRPLADHGFALLVPDRRGYGRSPPADGEDFLADAGDIAELMGDGAHLVGHSYGGLGAMFAAARRPDATLSLTLLEPGAFALGQQDPAARALMDRVRLVWDEDLPDGVRCDALDESDLTIVGEAESPDFQLTQPGVYVTVGSTANVYRTLGDASASWKRGTSAKTATCFADIVRLSAPEGQRVVIESATKLAFPKVAPKTAAFRVVATLTISGTRIRAYIDAIILQRGRIQSGILLTSLGRPVGRTDALGFAAVLAERMAKAAAPKGPTA